MSAAARDPAAIRAGIERARQQIEQSVSELRANVSWRSYVRRHPRACFTGALLAGLMLARVISR